MSTSRRSLRILDNAIKIANPPIAKAAKAAKTKVDNGFDLSTELSKKSKDQIAKNIKDEETYKIEDEDWVEFFCDFIEYIQNNIDLC